MGCLFAAVQHYIQLASWTVYRAFNSPPPGTCKDKGAPPEPMGVVFAEHAASSIPPASRVHERENSKPPLRRCNAIDVFSKEESAKTPLRRCNALGFADATDTGEAVSELVFICAHYTRLRWTLLPADWV